MARRLSVMAVALGFLCLGYMTLGVQAGWGFTLPYRGAKLASLLLVGLSVSTATLLFQTLTGNRLLTPSVMGFDALYLVIVSVLVFALGAQGFYDLPPVGMFLGNVTLMVLASLALFATLLRQARPDLMRLILTGIIFGALFRSLANLLQRMIDPNDYSAIQFASYARFAAAERELLILGGAVVLLVLTLIWHMRHRLDVLALGAVRAQSLGVNPRPAQIQLLALIAVLVSLSTAMVGPVVFVGLLVVNLAHLLTPVARHAVLLPSAALVSCLTLVGGQFLLERLALQTPLLVVIDVVGGLVFLSLLLKGVGR